MAMYTIELRTLINDYNYRLFDDYAFYTDDKKVKAEFEKLFIETFYFHEIGCETPERFKWMLKARLNLIMPYYKQLYQTEWTQVNKDMMNSKDLTETTTHTLTSNQSGKQAQQGTSDSSSQSTGSGTETSKSSSQSNGSGTETSESKAQSSGSGEANNHSTDLESALENGVPQVHLETDLTRKAQSDSTSSSSSTASSQSESTSSSSSKASSESDSTSSSSSEASSQSDSNTTSTSQATSSNHATNNSSLTNQQQNQLEETTTFTSKGDIGIQTPAYAIAEWRKVLININQMIIEECHDLFMKIY